MVMTEKKVIYVIMMKYISHFQKLPKNNNRIKDNSVCFNMLEYGQLVS